MSTKRIVVVTSLLVALGIAGCAHRAPAPPTEGESAAPAIDPTTPEGIVALGKRLTTYRRAVFSITRETYNYYAGGIINAEYDVSNQILKIASLAPGRSDVMCEYSPHGILFVDPKDHADKKDFEATCKHLALSLNEHLSQ
jgi:hypothetical protein